jgi:methylglutaconyl-CoA hydratase
LPSLIGIPRARDMILTGRRVSGPEAYFLGLTDRLVEVTPRDEEQGERWKKWIDQARDSSETEQSASAQKELDAEVMAQARPLVLGEAFRLATEICEGGPVAVRAALQAVSEPSEVMENTMYGRVIVTDDRNEALKAFADKRKPQFTGR